jgi:hypothetical protein
MSDIWQVVRLLQSKFGRLEVELLADNGEMSEQDYEDKVKEAFHQLGVELEE